MRRGYSEVMRVAVEINVEEKDGGRIPKTMDRQIENDMKITGISNYEGEREFPWGYRTRVTDPIHLKLKQYNTPLVISCS